MQTFLPFPGFIESAESLHDSHLNKQGVEAYQILLAITRVRHATKKCRCHGLTKWHKGGTWDDLPRSQWRFYEHRNLARENHPVTRMWEGYEHSLYLYAAACRNVFARRGGNEQMLPKLDHLFDSFWDAPDDELPWFIGHNDFHRAMQSNLIRKIPEHYGPQFGDVPNDLPYLYEEPNA